MYRIIITRCKDNPLTGKAQYRVFRANYLSKMGIFPIVYPKFKHRELFGLIVMNYIQPGCYINPTRALKETLSTVARTDERTAQMNMKILRIL
jgi:hypothetical protein